MPAGVTGGCQNLKEPWTELGRTSCDHRTGASPNKRSTCKKWNRLTYSRYTLLSPTCADRRSSPYDRSVQVRVVGSWIVTQISLSVPQQTKPKIQELHVKAHLAGSPVKSANEADHRNV